jgi:DNA-directed RNA polymerase specialized sigma24 family protein
VFIGELPGNAGKVMRQPINGYKYVEIAVRMEIPIGTVKTRINISRSILKQRLKDYLN